MSSLGGLYLNRHRSQYDAGATVKTRRQGCTWTSVANGADAASRGRVDKAPDQVLALVLPSEETNPATPGWSITDAVLAAHRLGVPLEDRSGRGWAAVVDAWNHGLYVILQGDSDQFSGATCSGDFDGDHAIGSPPQFRIVDGRRQRWIDDPICPTGRWEFESVLRAYAAKYSATIRFGAFTTPVPAISSATAAARPAVTLRFGGRKVTPIRGKRIRIGAAKFASIHARPASSSPIPARIANGRIFTVAQVTKTGQLRRGSRTWYGDRTGTRWLPESAF